MQNQFISCVKVAEGTIVGNENNILTKQENEVLKAGGFWDSTLRATYATILDKLVYAVTDRMGWQRTEITAEMAATVIALCVPAHNWPQAAQVFSDKETIASKITGIADEMNASRLLAMAIAVDAGLVDVEAHAKKETIREKRRRSGE